MVIQEREGGGVREEPPIDVILKFACLDLNITYVLVYVLYSSVISRVYWDVVTAVPIMRCTHAVE